MNYKIIVLAPSCGGKSSLMRYLREHTDLQIAETDEEVMKANNDVWRDNDLKNQVLVPQTTKEIISRKNVIYFASYIPDDLLIETKQKGFKIVILEVPLKILIERNKKRMAEEKYDDVSPWFSGQLDNFRELKSKGIMNYSINGNQDIEKVADDLKTFVEYSY